MCNVPKVFTSITEQIEKQISRGLQISNKESACKIIIYYSMDIRDCF